MKKEIVIPYSILAVILIIGGLCYHFTDYSKDDIPVKHNRIDCDELIYFNPSDKKFDTTYVEVSIKKDSLYSFKAPTGRIWFRKDFANVEINNVDYGDMWDITVNDGERFKLTAISNSGCLIKSKMDSIKNQISTDDQPDDDN